MKENENEKILERLDVDGDTQDKNANVIVISYLSTV